MEGLLKTCIHFWTRVACEKPDDYEARANLMDVGPGD